MGDEIFAVGELYLENQKLYQAMLAAHAQITQLEAQLREQATELADLHAVQKSHSKYQCGTQFADSAPCWFPLGHSGACSWAFVKHQGGGHE